MFLVSNKSMFGTLVFFGKIFPKRIKSFPTCLFLMIRGPCSTIADHQSCRSVFHRRAFCVSRDSELKMRQIDHCSLPAFYLSLVGRIHICSTRSLSRKTSERKGRALDFWRDLAHLNLFHTLHAMSCVFLAEKILRMILLKIGFQRFSVWLRFDLMSQSLYSSFSCCISCPTVEYNRP